jgi:excisionase family DNA binding protein
MLQLPERVAYTIAEVITVTGFGRDKVYKLINEKQLVARKCGRKTLITADELKRFLSELPSVA